MDNCVFCRIVRGELPASKVYEDEHTLAIMDIQSVNPGHSLVLVKPHRDRSGQDGFPIASRARGRLPSGGESAAWIGGARWRAARPDAESATRTALAVQSRVAHPPGRTLSPDCPGPPRRRFNQTPASADPQSPIGVVRVPTRASRCGCGSWRAGSAMSSLALDAS